MKWFVRAVVTTVLAQSPAPNFRADWAVVLPDESWRGFFKQCSRPAPALVGSWEPDPETVRALEPVLAVALREALQRQIEEPSRRPATQEYYRQYIGIQVGDRRVVYINGFHQRYLELTATARPELASGWQTRLVNVCDGGWLFFGAEYDPATREVSNVYFNGRG